MKSSAQSFLNTPQRIRGPPRLYFLRGGNTSPAVAGALKMLISPSLSDAFLFPSVKPNKHVT